MAFGTITPLELHQMQASGQPLDLIDVRTPAEYASGHAVGARLLPLPQVTLEAVQAGRPADAIGPTYVICQSGGRSRQACQRLAQAGLPHVVNVEGGTAAWRAAGLPVESAAGSSRAALPNWARGVGLLLVLVCLGLAWAVHPWFAFASLAIWLGLLIAGRGACPLNTCATPPARGDQA